MPQRCFLGCKLDEYKDGYCCNACGFLKGADGSITIKEVKRVEITEGPYGGRGLTMPFFEITRTRKDDKSQ